jgi:alkylation response protein AidB-like acyl-CoA dehydrogenase
MSALSLDPIEREVVETFRDVLAKEDPLALGLAAANAGAASPGYDRSLLERLAELGFFGVSCSGDAGGLELSTGVLGALCVEAGRALLGGPWLEQLLAVGLLDAVGAPAPIEQLVAGSLVVSLPLDGPTWRVPPPAQVDGDRARFAPARCEIGFASGVDAWLLPARDVATGTVVLVRLDADPARCQGRRRWSELWRSDDVDLAGAEGTVVAQLGEPVTAAHLLDTARLLAATSVGSTEAVLASATEFLKVREQFGRPIGSFQALQHRLADVYIELEHTRALVRATLGTPPGEELALLVTMAKVAADRMGVSAAETALQVHGGLGFTWELPVHHYLKEALRRRTLPEPTAVARQELRRLVVEYRI